MKKLYGLIGYPVKHSLSALMHNAAFKHLGIEAEYKLFEVKPHKLQKFFTEFRWSGISGVNITIPHKRQSLYFMDDLSSKAKLTEAINTVALKGDRLVGYNTDGIGFLRALKEDLGFSPKGKIAFILGAGGAGRAVTFSLAKEEVSRIMISDIDMDKAAILARDIEKKTRVETVAVEFGGKGAPELILNSDLLVNATPIGMKKTDKPLIPADFLHRSLAVFDLIYNPEETNLLKEARKKKLKACNGLGMLVYQGAAAFELWTGKPAPLEVMRKAIKC